MLNVGLVFSLFFSQLEDLNFPEIKRKKQEERKEEDKKEFKELFELDTDSDEESTGIAVKGRAAGLGTPLLASPGFAALREQHVHFKRRTDVEREHSTLVAFQSDRRQLGGFPPPLPLPRCHPSSF